MPMVITDDSALGRELWKWNHTAREIHPSDEDKPAHEQLHGLRPCEFQPFPQMLYRAQQHPISKQMRCMDVDPDTLNFSTINEYERALNQITRFNAACSVKVQTDEDRRRKLNDGWFESPVAAMEGLEKREIAIADEAARRHFTDQRMSQKAQAEADTADRSTSKHVLDVVGSSKKTRGRKKKITAVIATN